MKKRRLKRWVRELRTILIVYVLGVILLLATIFGYANALN